MKHIKSIILLFLACSIYTGFSQVGEPEQEQPVEDINFQERKTNNIENQIVQHSSLVEKEEKLVEIRKTSTKNTYTGNLCAEETARKYHFKYVFDHDGGNGFRHFFPNQFKLLMLTFKNGLFWRSRYRHELKDCISRTGDYVG